MANIHQTSSVTETCYCISEKAVTLKLEDFFVAYFTVKNTYYCGKHTVTKITFLHLFVVGSKSRSWSLAGRPVVFRFCVFTERL